MNYKPALEKKDLESFLYVANKSFQNGQEKEALAYLHRQLKSYDSTSEIPAYLYVKYEDLWIEYRRRYHFNYEVVKMSDAELGKRIHDAKILNRIYNKRDEWFQFAAKDIFDTYLKGWYSTEWVRAKLDAVEEKYLSTALSKEFLEKLQIILDAYLFRRNMITREILEQYRDYFQLCYKVETVEKKLKKVNRERRNRIMEDLKRQGESTQNNQAIKNLALQLERKLLAMTPEERQEVLRIWYALKTRWVVVAEDPKDDDEETEESQET